MICKHCDKADKTEEYHKGIILFKYGYNWKCPRCKVAVADPYNSWYPNVSPDNCSHGIIFDGRCILCKELNKEQVYG
jgi:hypothetical protein